jgi:hypothetical protein
MVKRPRIPLVGGHEGAHNVRDLAGLSAGRLRVHDLSCVAGSTDCTYLSWIPVELSNQPSCACNSPKVRRLKTDLRRLSGR